MNAHSNCTVNLLVHDSRHSASPPVRVNEELDPLGLDAVPIATALPTIVQDSCHSASLPVRINNEPDTLSRTMTYRRSQGEKNWVSFILYGIFSCSMFNTCTVFLCCSGFLFPIAT